MTPLPQVARDVLIRAAGISPEKGISIISNGQSTSSPDRITYAQLLQQTKFLSQAIRNIPGIKPETIILLHLDKHKDHIPWLWAIIAAGLVPTISTPFTNDMEQRKKHLAHLKNILQDPIVITRQGLVSEFASMSNEFSIFTIERLTESLVDQSFHHTNFARAEPDGLFALMLTSGSTGNSKAVALRHGQVIAAVEGKAALHNTTKDDVFLNWIGMDHVANLVESHLLAMYLGAEQVHVQAIEVIAQPMLFLKLIEEHKASFTFAPNFFLASLRKTLLSVSRNQPMPDLSSLKILASGGEANGTALAASMEDLLGALGAQKHVVRPGFGMTETCAGSIHNTQCPTFDLQHGREFASLGRCIPCMEMRVTRTEQDGTVTALQPDQVGDLEVRGDNVFREYYNNPEATAASFRPGGWFCTGDLACIDAGGNLHLVGREKETIIVNGVKYYPHEIEGAIEDAAIPGVTPSFTAVFPYRAQNAASETICVVYLPSYGQDEDAVRLEARSAIRSVVMRHCTARPHKIIPLDRIHLSKTALGKLSRNKIKKAFEAGVYSQAVAFDEECIARVTKDILVKPSTPVQKTLQAILADVFDLSPSEIGITTNFFDLGCSSLEVFTLKWQMQNTPGFPKSIPITKIIGNPTIRLLSSALGLENNCSTPVNGEASSGTYEPIVVLRSTGSKPPLWLIHPGVGEILVFLNLARQITDRPVYALRARGFDGEPFFASLDEMAATYVAAIRRLQPEGPYVLAGYSFGGTVAFEMAKTLREDGDEVPFLAVFDQPPHIKHRMRQGGWADVLLILARFFDLLPDKAAEDKVAKQLRGVLQADGVNGHVMGDREKERLVDILLSESSEEALVDYGLDKTRLARWTSLALNSHTIARDYEPRGRVPVLDVFFGHPIPAVAPSKMEWLEKKLALWSGFVDDVQFHEVAGDHYTLIAPENVVSFARGFKSRLQARGV